MIWIYDNDETKCRAICTISTLTKKPIYYFIIIGILLVYKYIYYIYIYIYIYIGIYMCIYKLEVQ